MSRGLSTKRIILRYLLLASGFGGFAILVVKSMGSLEAFVYFPVSASIALAIALLSAIPEHRKNLQTLERGGRLPDRRWLAAVCCMVGMSGIPMLLKPLGKQPYETFVANLSFGVSVLALALAVDLWRRPSSKL